MVRAMLQVSQADIDAGRRLDPLACPLAIAFDRQLPQAAPWRVAEGRADGRGLTAGRLRYRLQDFIADFDAGGQVSPGEFLVMVEESRGAR